MYTANDANQLSPSNVRGLALKWKFTPHGSIAASPTAESGGVYAADEAGYVYKVNPDTGAQIWAVKLSTYTGTSNSYALSSPAISGSSVVLGDRAGPTLIALDKSTGALLWKSKVDTHPLGLITGAPTIYNGVVYVGVASGEESAAVNDTYIPYFRGSVVAVNLSTGKMIWQFRTVPPPPDSDPTCSKAGDCYSGAGVWGSNIVVAPSLGAVFAGTGDNYSVPSAVASCVAAAGSNTTDQLACLDPTDYVDAVVALDIKTGSLKWARRFGGADSWTVGCLMQGYAGCPSPKGKDADFASAPNLLRMPSFTGVSDDRGGTSNGWLLGAGEKSGKYWAMNPTNGGLFWNTLVGNGDILWGSAAGNLWSDFYIFSAIDTQTATNNLLGRPAHAGVTGWKGGFWTALQASTGKIMWQVPAGPKDLVRPRQGSDGQGPGQLLQPAGLHGRFRRKPERSRRPHRLYLLDVQHRRHGRLRPGDFQQHGLLGRRRQQPRSRGQGALRLRRAELTDTAARGSNARAAVVSVTRIKTKCSHDEIRQIATRACVSSIIRVRKSRLLVTICVV